MHFPHWQFFESVDDDLHYLSRYVEFTPKNYPTFSVHLTRLYLSVCSEIDVVAKLLCTRIAPAEQPKNINDYRSLITEWFPHFSQLRIEMPTHALEFQPWLAWQSGDNPKWWRSYNDVKHERNKYYQDANLGNVLESAAGLLVMLIYFHQPELYAKSQPFKPDFKMMRIERRYAFCALSLAMQYNFPDFGNSVRINHPELYSAKAGKQ